MKKSHQKVVYSSRISDVSEIFPYCPTAQMAEFMFPNVAYRATVYRTGDNTVSVHTTQHTCILEQYALSTCFLLC